jgi:hypothetical protein
MMIAIYTQQPGEFLFKIPTVGEKEREREKGEQIYHIFL